MKKPIKASLLSAFVIPGAGHIYLKQYLVAGILIIFSLAALSVLIVIAIEQAMVMSEQILSGNVPPNLTSITQLVTTQMSNSDSLSASWATVVLAISWIIGVVDSYRIGIKEEKVNNS